MTMVEANGWLALSASAATSSGSARDSKHAAASNSSSMEVGPDSPGASLQQLLQAWAGPSQQLPPSGLPARSLLGTDQPPEEGQQAVRGDDAVRQQLLSLVQQGQAVQDLLASSALRAAHAAAAVADADAASVPAAGWRAGPGAAQLLDDVKEPLPAAAVPVVLPAKAASRQAPAAPSVSTAAPASGSRSQGAAEAPTALAADGVSWADVLSSLGKAGVTPAASSHINTEPAAAADVLLFPQRSLLHADIPALPAAEAAGVPLAQALEQLRRQTRRLSRWHGRPAQLVDSAQPRSASGISSTVAAARWQRRNAKRARDMALRGSAGLHPLAAAAAAADVYLHAEGDGGLYDASTGRRQLLQSSADTYVVATIRINGALPVACGPLCSWLQERCCLRSDAQLSGRCPAR
jgi:hypothetical protein